MYKFPWSKFIHLIILFIWCIVTVNSLCDSNSEYYSERNFINKLKDDQHKKVIQSQILTLFGLSNRPNITTERYKLRSNYLNAIYDQYSGLKGVNVISTRFTNKAIEESDVIISFDSQFLSNISNKISKFFKFNISKAFAYENVIRSELVFINKLNTTTIWIIQVNVNSKLHNVTLNYEMTKSRKNEDNWVKIDFTNIFKKMIYENEKEFQIEISLFLMDKGDGMKKILPVNDFVNEMKKPTLVSYFKSNANIYELNNRIKRDLTSNSQIESKFISHRSSSRKACQLNSFFISFQELGWQDWIIAPEGYKSFFCSGQCSFPLKDTSNATNHAIIQSLMQLLNPQNYPKPCCAALKFASIELLYLDDDKNVTWKKHKNMVPNSCGCV